MEPAAAASAARQHRPERHWMVRTRDFRRQIFPRRAAPRPEASWPSATFPIVFWRALPRFCFSRSFFLRSFPRTALLPPVVSTSFRSGAIRSAGHDGAVDAGLDDALEELARDVPSQYLSTARRPRSRASADRVAKARASTGSPFRSTSTFATSAASYRGQLVDSERRVPP